MNDLLLDVDRGNAVILALLDLSAAFDTVDHRILLDRMSCRFGVSGSAIQWFRSYLSGRMQQICVKSESSSPMPMPYGVPQGSVLGPIFFIIYNIPLHNIASSHGIPEHGLMNNSTNHFACRMTGKTKELPFHHWATALRNPRRGLQQTS